MVEIKSKSQVVLCHREPNGVAVVTIDRPERRNALNLEVKKRIAEQVSSLVADGTVKVIVLTGAGGYFVAGTDLAEMAAMTPTQHVALSTDHVFNVLRHCPKPLIAALEGYALGGGCELALSCDMIIAGRSTKLGQPEIRVGIMPGAGGTQRLVRVMGKYHAMKLILTGEPVSAPDARSQLRSRRHSASINSSCRRCCSFRLCRRSRWHHCSWFGLALGCCRKY
jgi:enoyl-CoA hydratase